MVLLGKVKEPTHSLSFNVIVIIHMVEGGHPHWQLTPISTHYSFSELCDQVIYMVGRTRNYNDLIADITQLRVFSGAPCIKCKKIILWFVIEIEEYLIEMTFISAYH